VKQWLRFKNLGKIKLTDDIKMISFAAKVMSGFCVTHYILPEGCNMSSQTTGSRYLLAAGITTFLALSSTRTVLAANPVAPYGNLQNSSTFGWCGATAVTNSLEYLQSKNPNLTLIDGSLSQTRNDILNLEDGITPGNPPTGNPSSNATIWNSKVTYCNEFAPGEVSFAAQITSADAGGFSGWVDSGDIQNSKPTDAFLQQQLADGEDVELLFEGTTTDASDDSASNNLSGGASTKTFSHAITLTDLDSEDGEMTYIDPNNPTLFLTTTVTTDGAGYLSFNWNNQGANDPVNGVEIFGAFAESVPSPSAGSTAVLCLLMGLGLRRRGWSKAV
jgi:hypothetical protein